ncbi:Fe-S cluster assembly protein SufD [Schleiferilactobacillus shenzhenensis]|uniref:SUF system FeS cluster assembly SufBD core domain-containing protein n=1 Tax=Schleiferilactobacillus shenzhenensis LY-73 TaxID=1231336 RepID=U4TQF7_9LACO|nr:Fe-S cluster assembly protein SufD [Schleiferilactobacillus shenzhenensis]ERL66434.1 hypothetical protein L248_0113 [Schleiferilactobacillus shenzhenensis LY-73]
MAAFGPKQLDPAAIAAAYGPLDADPWLTTQRQAAAAAYADAPWPEFAKVTFHPWKLFGDGTAAGVTYPEGAPAAPAGVTIQPLLTAPAAVLAPFKPYLFHQTAPTDRLTAYHLAHLNSGFLIRVPDHFHSDQPLVLNTQLLAGVNAHRHLLLLVGRDAQITVVDHFTGEAGADSADSIVTEIVVGEDSRVDFANVDAFGANITAFVRRQAQVAANGILNWTAGVLNDGNIIADTSTNLVGTGSTADVKVVALATGKQVQGLNTRVTNIGRQTTANILQHGVILENATLVFNGIGHIVKGARGADAQQENRVLMLSRTAHGDANPILLIDENDVKAGHAASVGRVDASQMYYLMSRGLTKELAQRLVIRGFLGAVLTAIPLPAIQQQLIDTIERKLIHGQRIAHQQS